VSLLLETRGLFAGYGEISVVADLDIEVGPGEVVALLGPNGAGKSTTLLTLAGELAPLGGSVSVFGRTNAGPLHRRAQNGLAFVTEERSVFMRMSTAQNLRVGRCAVNEALELFPELRNLLSRRAGLLSGGEQQMLTVARALARRPKLFLGDELSLGLAPIVVGRLLEAVRRAANNGVGCLLVEQHVHRVLDIADRVYVLQRGRLEFSGRAADARRHLAQIEAAYLTGGTSVSD
jgi:branched-chain amino acid transport system ATP-binding protein